MESRAPRQASRSHPPPITVFITVFCIFIVTHTKQKTCTSHIEYCRYPGTASAANIAAAKAEAAKAAKEAKLQKQIDKAAKIAAKLKNKRFLRELQNTEKEKAPLDSDGAVMVQ